MNKYMISNLNFHNNGIIPKMFEWKESKAMLMHRKGGMRGSGILL